MPSQNLVAKANTGAGTDQLAGVTTGAGFVGAVMLTDAAGADIASGNPLPVSVTGSVEITNDVGGAIPVSAASLPLPSGAATETTLAAINDYFKAEDAPAVSGDKGLPLLAMRQLADTTSTDADGDYTLIKIDEEGRVKVATKPASFTLVTGNITANAQTVFCDVSRASNVLVSMVATTLVGHNVTFEGSIDSTNGTNGNWFIIQAIRTNANTVETTTGTLAATPTYAWECSVNGLAFVRVRATAHTSGTATWNFQRGSYATEPIPAAQVSGTQPVSGTLTSAGTTTNTPATPTASNIISAASTNATVVKGSAGTVYAINCSNGNGSASRSFKLYNKATAPVPGTDVAILSITVPANGVFAVDMGALGHRLSLGIGIAITAGALDADTTAVNGNECKMMISYI